MSAAAAELKPLVKSLNSASTDEVCGVFPPCSLGFPDLLERPQEIVTILNTLKQHAKITEAVLRVSVALSRGIPHSHILLPIGKQSGIGCGQVALARFETNIGTRKGDREEMED